MSDEENEENKTEIVVSKQKGPIDLSDEPLLDLPIDSNSLISGPRLSESSTFKLDVLQFQKSFGFDCKRLFNVCLIVPDVLVFASGNFIHFFTISNRRMTTRRSSTGGGIGYITKNPNPDYNFLTVAENGDNPPIIIYRYPDMKVMAICENGTETAYTFVDYSADGEMMVSQGGQSDFMITLWKWKSGTVILRTRSFSNTVFKVTFSQYNMGMLSTCGVGHIKFWQICETFTGLKLVGEHGRFGKTEICDIVGAYAMPVGTTLSGSEWGNILVWQEGLIKFEVCRKNRKQCHQGPISELYLRDGDVMTVGRDGYVRIWFWETVELADPPDEDRFVEIEPIYEYRIGSEEHTCSLMAMVKRDAETWWWYAQDANGGLWMADISPENHPEPSQMLFRSHAGGIVGVAACPFGNYIATFGADGRLHVYDYVADKLLFWHQFVAKGCCMIWLPLVVDASGVVLVLGFADGVVRVVCIDLQTKQPAALAKQSMESPRVFLLQVWKPHRLALTKMSLNSRNTILVTGSEDATLFIHQVFKQEPFVRINAIGYVDIPSAASALNWKPNMMSTLIVGCAAGEVVEMDVPERPRSYTELSYQLTHIECKRFKFESKKSELRREIKLAEIERLKLEKRNRKMKSLERLRSDNPDIKIDEEAFLADSDSDEEMEPIFIPPVPNAVLWLMYTQDNTVWLSMGQYDCGYVYEFQFGSKHPMQCTPIVNAEDLEINCYLYYEDYIVFGMQDGSIRINMVQRNHRDLSDYWSLTMHDNFNGCIRDMCFSYDLRFLFSVGADGNIFSYKWNLNRMPMVPSSPLVQRPEPFPDESVADIDDPEALSLEEQKQKNNRDKRAMIANERKRQVLTVIANYKRQFDALMKRNRAMVAQQRLNEENIMIEERITESLQESLLQQSQLVKRKLAFDLEKNRLLVQKVQEFFIEPVEDLITEVFSLRTPMSVKTFRVNYMGSDFHEMVAFVEKMIKIEADSKRVIKVIEDTGPEEKKREQKRLESFLEVLTASTIEFRLGLQPSRLLRKYRARKEAERLSKEQWEYIYSIVPDVNKNDPKDDAALREAAATIGDYKLRTDAAYVSTDSESSSASLKYQQLLGVREELGSIRSNYNKEVFKLRSMKQQLTAYIDQRREHLERFVHKEIKPEAREYPYEFCASLEHLEYPEYAIESKGYAVAKSPIKLMATDNFNFFTYPIKQISIFIANEDRYQAMLKESDRSSNVLNELIQIRLEERVFEQRQLMDDIEMRIRRFDDELHRLHESRLQIEVAVKFLDVFLLTLNQELWVLRDFKQLEDKLIGNVNDKIIAQNNINAELTSTKQAIEQHRKNIEQGGVDEKLLTTQFVAAATGNKFWDFLRKAYKKKFRPPKVIDPDDYDVSSESSDESSSDDEGDDDAESRDSMEIGPIHMDETVCPAGCDRNLYDLTFDLRSRRHRVEQFVRAENVAIDTCKQTIEKLNRTRKIVEKELQIRNDEQQAFQNIKQKTLNEIDTLVILKMSQLQYFVTQEQFEKIEDTILFNNDCVNSLYARVAEIELETQRARQQHRINVMHLSRMKTDCKYMEKLLADLAEEFDMEMLKKFGMRVDLDELEEGILRRMVFDIRANIDEIQREYGTKARELRSQYATAQEELKCVVQQEIEKLNVLTVLQEEQNWLKAMMRKRHVKGEDDSAAGSDVDFENDVMKLSAIANQQLNEIALLTNEINMLRRKSKNLDDITQPPEADDPNPEPPFRCRSPYQQMRTNCDDSEFSYQTQRSGQSVAQFLAVTQVIETFFDKYRSQVDAQLLHQLTQRISVYFASITRTLTDEPEKRDTQTQQVVEQFRSMIPSDLWTRFSSAEVAQLFQNLVKAIAHDEDAVSHRIRTSDLLKSLLEDTYDSLMGDEAKSMQIMLTESLKNMIVSMNAEDIRRPAVVAQLVRSLGSRVTGPMTPETVHKETVYATVMAHGEEHYVDGLNGELLRGLIDEVVGGLMEDLG